MMATKKKSVIKPLTPPQILDEYIRTAPKAADSEWTETFKKKDLVRKYVSEPQTAQQILEGIGATAADKLMSKKIRGVGKKLVRRRPLPRFKLGDAMLTELNPDSKYVICFHADPGDMSQAVIDHMRTAWERVMGTTPAFVIAFTKDIEMDIYEVKS